MAKRTKKVGVVGKYHPLWRVASQNHQEDGDNAAFQVYVLVLRQGEHEARRRRHLALHDEELPYQDRWRRLDALNGCRFLSQVGHQEVEGDQGALNISSHLSILLMALSDQQK